MIDVDTDEKMERRRQHFIQQWRKQLMSNPYYAATKLFEWGALGCADIELLNLASALNEAGFTVQLVLKEKVDLEWDGQKVKELLWRPSQKAILGKKSTSALSKIEDIDKVYDHLSRHLGEKFSIHVPFPSYETPYDQAPLRTDP